MTTRKMVDRFLSWPLPETVCADPCASMPGTPHRSGTTLLNATEAEAMFLHVLGQPRGWLIDYTAAVPLSYKLDAPRFVDDAFELDRIRRQVLACFGATLEAIPLYAVLP